MAQTLDIEQLLEAKPFSVSGNFSTDLLFTETNPAPLSANQSPFQYFITGDITATLYGKFSIPISFSYTNRRFDSRFPGNQQSLNRFGISPKYKWLTVHAGWSSMQFSKYSLNGHNFLGGGVEAKPGKYILKAMHGRLLDEVIPIENPETRTGNRPVYERWGSGIQVSFANKGNTYGASVFRSSDRPFSIPGGLDSIGLTPEDNFVLAFNLNRKINRFMTFLVDYGNSQLTADNRQNANGERDLGQTLSFVRNNSTKSYHAIKTDLGFRIQKMNVKLGYERIAPGYTSHGAYFYNNDIENFTTSFAAPIAGNKVNINTSIGLGRDNLGSTKTSTSNRLIGQVNLAWHVNQKLNLNANYSNFSNITEFNPLATLPQANPFDAIDSLRYVQVSRTTALNANYSTAGKTLGHSLSGLLNVMQTDATLGGENQETGGDFLTSNISYNLTFVPQRLSATFSCAYNRTATPNQKFGTLGPVIGLSKALFKKIRTNLMYVRIMQLSGNSGQGDIQRVQLSSAYTLKENHQISLNSVWMYRKVQAAIQDGQSRITTYLARIRYQYSF